MFRRLLSAGEPAAAAAQGQQKQKPVTLLVLQADKYDWPELFQGVVLRDGRPLRVVQTGWDNIDVFADTYSSAGFCVDVRKAAPSATVQPNERYPTTIQPDFILVRNEVRTPDFDGRNLLNGMLFANVPACNSLQSILLSCERPMLQGQLHGLQRKLGKERFPVVPAHFASSYRSLMYGYTFPAVVKVGSAHAGCGKMLINDHHQMSDFRSVMHMMPQEHCMVEPFIRGEVDLRIQKIGEHCRSFRRTDVSGEWKTNTGTAIMEEVPMEDRWKLWLDSAAELLGGLDIFAVDAIVEQGTGKEYILEVNGTSIGLHPDREAEDNLHIRDLVLEKMNLALCSEPHEG